MASEESKRFQKAERDERDANTRMKADRQSGRPVKGRDVGDMADAAYRKGKAQQEMAVKNDQARKGKGKK